jgi:hypothetical protein
MTKELIKSKDRKDEHGEVFTPHYIVKEMLDLLPPGILNDPYKTFLDPTCGNGNILVTILEDRLKNGLDPLLSASTLFGIDIQEDNVQDTRDRLIKLVPEASSIINKHIRCMDILEWLKNPHSPLVDWESDRPWPETLDTPSVHDVNSDFF